MVNKFITFNFHFETKLFTIEVYLKYMKQTKYKNKNISLYLFKMSSDVVLVFLLLTFRYSK